MARDMGAAVAIPMHYDMFSFNTEGPDGFVAECGRLRRPYAVLRCGERWSP